MILQNFVDRFLGRGEAAVTVPALDGALKPNNVLEEAAPGLLVEAPDNLVVSEARLLFSSGGRLEMRSPEGTSSTVCTFAGPITALALSTSGMLAVGLGKTVQIFDAIPPERPRLVADRNDWSCVTAMAFEGDGSLLVAIGSSKNGLDDWQRDLLDHQRAGSVWRIDTKTGEATRLIDRLAYPNGIIVQPDGHIIVSEAWQKRLIRLNAAGKLIDQVIEDLPGYPARLSPSSSGGYWLSVFAPRSQLIEFVLRERAYRRAMMSEVDKQFWIAPALRSGQSFREPMEGGALKQMGILKPWAPTRSYGLIIELSADFVPLRSFHSRAGGRRHGITSAIENGGTLWATSKGGNEVIAVILGREGI